MTCLSCGSLRVYPSRLRGLLEKSRHMVTGQQPYRCHGCNWRKWGPVVVHETAHPDTRPEDLRTGRAPAPVNPSELDQLDPAKPGS